MLAYLLTILFFITIYDKKNKFKAIPILILVNIILFGIGYITEVYLGVDYVKVLLAYHSNGGISKFWSCYTSSIVHNDISHLFSNIIILYIISPLFKNVENMLVLKMYFFGNLIALFTIYLFMFCCGVFELQFTSLGASAGIFTLLGYMTFNYPFKTLKFGIFYTKVIYLTYYLLIVSILSILAQNNTLGNVSHIGGFFFAYYLYKTNRDTQVKKL